MTIRKFGTEPAKTEVRAEDNDRETLAVVKAQASSEAHRYPCDLEDCPTCRAIRKQ